MQAGHINSICVNKNPISRRCFNYDKLIDLAKKWND
ncbi:Protein of unknown function [Lactobacillus helveticus CIRM-BIA 103]|nr:Protein of unknown function [Lactobacillus helveticus CIRM-BIA 103]